MKLLFDTHSGRYLFAAEPRRHANALFREVCLPAIVFRLSDCYRMPYLIPPCRRPFPRRAWHQNARRRGSIRTTCATEPRAICCVAVRHELHLRRCRSRGCSLCILALPFLAPNLQRGHWCPLPRKMCVGIEGGSAASGTPRVLTVVAAVVVVGITIDTNGGDSRVF